MPFLHPQKGLLEKVPVEFKKYLHGVIDAGTRLLFRSGTHGLNEELGRHRVRERKSYTLCSAKCESMVHVLWECSAYSSSRASFMVKLEELLEIGMQILKC